MIKKEITLQNLKQSIAGFNGTRWGKATKDATSLLLAWKVRQRQQRNSRRLEAFKYHEQELIQFCERLKWKNTMAKRDIDA